MFFLLWITSSLARDRPDPFCGWSRSCSDLRSTGKCRQQPRQTYWQTVVPSAATQTRRLLLLLLLLFVVFVILFHFAFCALMGSSKCFLERVLAPVLAPLPGSGPPLSVGPRAPAPGGDRTHAAAARRAPAPPAAAQPRTREQPRLWCPPPPPCPPAARPHGPARHPCARTLSVPKGVHMRTLVRCSAPRAAACPRRPALWCTPWRRVRARPRRSRRPAPPCTPEFSPRINCFSKGKL